MRNKNPAKLRQLKEENPFYWQVLYCVERRALEILNKYMHACGNVFICKSNVILMQQNVKQTKFKMEKKS